MKPAQPDDQAHREGDVNSLYRSTFVGRDSELRQLQILFANAVAGESALVAVLGEPGIGKTSLCEQLANYASGHGARVLIGHCYEEGSLSLPYLPFIEALRGYILDRDPVALRSELAGGADAVARIVPDLREQLAIEPRPSGDPEYERWRLLQSVTEFLRSASLAQVLVLVLEDLHDADRATLDLLVHLSRNLQGSRLLVVGTYRDLEVDRTHPLSQALAELRRSSQFVRLALRGLTEGEVQRMLASISNQEIPEHLAELVHRQTEGSPLFVQELMRYLVERGLVGSRNDVSWRVGVDSLTEHIPEGLRDVIGQRLSRLSDRTNQVLTVASVFGREFELEALLRLVQLSENEVIAALEEAARVALVQEQPVAHARVRYRFTHAFFRQTLYAEISAPRRVRWHQQAAKVLEAVYANQLDEHAAELAEHFAHSSDPLDVGKAVTYGQLAARRAMSVYAFGEAVRQLERALDVEDVLDPRVGTRRCELLLALGEAVLPDEPLRVVESLASEAFALAEACHDSPRAARAAIQALDALFRSKSGTTVNMHEWVERADRHAAVGTAGRVYADSYLGINILQSGQRREGSVYFRRAVERARELDDDIAYVTAAGYALTFLNALSDFLFVERIAQEFQTRPHPGVRSGDLAAALESVARRLLARGDREEAEQAWRELSRLAEESRDPVVRIMETTARSTIAFLDGHLEEALVLGESALGLADAAGLAPTWNTTLRRARLLPACIRVHLGRPAEVSLASMLATAGSRRPELAERALLLSLLHQCAEALVIRADFGDVGLGEDDTAVFILAFLLEVSIRCHDATTAEALLPRLSSLGNHLQAWYHPTSFGRLLGEAAAMLGHVEAARAYLLQALEVDRKVRFRPDLALTRLDLAELLVEHFPDQRAEAVDLLQLAIAEFADMGMQPSLERALQVQRTAAGATVGSPTPTLDSEVDALTAREREVASLIGRGLSNRDIAAALVITEMTTETHVKHILAKLGFRSRAQVAVWATQHGLGHPADAAD